MGKGDQPRREDWDGKLPVGKEPEKGAVKRQEACNEETPRRENKASTGSGAGGAGAGDGRGPWERCPWWPGGQGEEGPPDPLQSSGAEAENSANLRQGKATKTEM
jgi:hypothetical protein